MSFVRVVGYGAMVAAVLPAALGIVLMYGGANPPPGGGSLGHVGMIVAGIILAFAAVLLGGLGWLAARRFGR